MPQFELDLTTSTSGTVESLQRARSPEEAVRRALGLEEAVRVDVADETDVQGWQAVALGDEPVGRVRLHQRMRFRRD